MISWLKSVIDQIIANHPTIAGMLVSGVFGASVKAALEPTITFRMWLVSVFVGAVTAVYVGGAVAEYLDLSNRGELGVSFVIGLAGADGLRALQRRIVTVIEKEGRSKK